MNVSPCLVRTPNKAKVRTPNKANVKTPNKAMQANNAKKLNINLHISIFMGEERKSYMELNKIYFYTATIFQWNKLLESDKYKQIIIDSLTFLTKKQLVKVYGFVIMPNHIHLIWQLLRMNGKEKPNASFLKFTAHSIEKDLRESEPSMLEYFEIHQSDRRYHFWQRDSLAVDLFSEKVFEQKLRYIHLNPMQEHWQLAEKAEEYFWSSAAFYEMGESNFDFLTDYRILF